jgi:tripartite-type tricarboxylate transporter receptor subunit TctC
MRTLILAAAVAMAVSAGADAQTVYPSRPVTMVVPFAAGGPTDVVARLFAQNMSRTLGQQVVVENVAGAAGSLGVSRVARAAPDGHTLLMGHMGTQIANMILYDNLTYDSRTDLEPVSLVLNVSQVLVTKKAMPVDGFAQFADFLKRNQATISYATAGVGSGSHIGGMLVQSAIGVRNEMIGYRGTGPAMNDLVAGHVDWMADQITNAVPQIRAGTIRAIAVLGDRRNPSLPDVPTTAEAGMAGANSNIWHAVYGPKGMPAPVVEAVLKAVREALADETVKARLVDLGGDLPPAEAMGPAALRRHMDEELARWTPIIRSVAEKTTLQ